MRGPKFFDQNFQISFGTALYIESADMEQRNYSFESLVHQYRDIFDDNTHNELSPMKGDPMHIFLDEKELAAT